MTAQYEDILYEIKDGVATITINRPDKYNAFRAQTCEEMIDAFLKAGWNKKVGVIVLTGAGAKALLQRHDREQGDNANGDNAGFERSQAHVAESEGFVLPLDDGEQRNGGADNAQGTDHFQERSQQDLRVRA